jgi:hypothetical protein
MIPRGLRLLSTRHAARRVADTGNSHEYPRINHAATRSHSNCRVVFERKPVL